MGTIYWHTVSPDLIAAMLFGRAMTFFDTHFLAHYAWLTFTLLCRVQAIQRTYRMVV